MPRFMIIGPVTRDTISRDGMIYHHTGGAVYFQSAVFSSFNMNITAVIPLSNSDTDLLNAFPENADLLPVFVEETMEFENIYPNHDLNHRIQRARVPDNPVLPENLPESLEAYDAAVLCPLSPTDIPIETVKYLSKYNVPIYMGAQGYLRHLCDDEIILKPWEDFPEFLKHVEFLFLDEAEARIVSGFNDRDLGIIGKQLSKFGPKEIIITSGDRGALIYSSTSNEVYRIHAFPPKQTMDPTGLGDTYMAAYASKRVEGYSPKSSGIFASMVSTMKLETIGVFKGNNQMVLERLNDHGITDI
jgi:sugar/nucleoside kinase (ribokinase family)